ncbi:unnamed protein product [Closterium sp. Naga37s-1]|nr:unnamed protein product [Closterium sp. Naga37s-1]
MDSDEDAPFTARRAKPAAAPAARPAAPLRPHSSPADRPRPSPGGGRGGGRTGAHGGVRPPMKSEPRHASDDDDDVPLGKLAAGTGSAPRPGDKRPAERHPWNGGARDGSGGGRDGPSPAEKRAKAEPVTVKGENYSRGSRDGGNAGNGSGGAGRVRAEEGRGGQVKPERADDDDEKPIRSLHPGSGQGSGQGSRQGSGQGSGPGRGVKKEEKVESEESEEGSEEEGSEEEGSEEEGSEEEGSDEESESESDEDVPLAKRAGAGGGAAGGAAGAKPGARAPAKTPTKPAGKGAAKGSAAGGAKKGKKEDNSVKWKTLSHNGVIFPPPYTPHGVKMLYNGKPVDLTPAQEEVATMFAVMRETEYATKPVFLKNFWNDWRKVLGSRHVIQKLELCDFTPIWDWHLAEKEKKKQMTSEEKKALKEEKLKAEEKYMHAVIDGLKEKVGNFRVEPPGLFRGRGEHPKMGKLKRRIMPEDIVINIGKEAPVPECPIPGHRWKEVRHDNTVTWLAYWFDPINQKDFKYVFLAPSSRLKGLSDKEKYEKARKLKDHIGKIRATYTKHFTSKDDQIRQVAVATYLIDRLALRAGNEKDDDEADTVGCCSLKVEHVTLVPPSSLQFDFLGKDSIRYFNTVEVEPLVYKAIGTFRKGKKKDEDLFDKLDTTRLNSHLKEIMPGLTAKVFRTYNASVTLDTLLQDTVGSLVVEKVADYQRANKEVAILCNHQRAVSKAHSAQMEKMQAKLKELEDAVEEMEEDLDRAQKGRPPVKREGEGARKVNPEALEKKLAQSKARLEKMKLDMSIKDELKTVALGTSKINYMDPRITIAWCKRHEVPIEKVRACGACSLYPLHTSKINYMDPRITIAWCKRHEVPIEKVRGL